MAKIYTKAGDDGTTGLIGGDRVSKDASRIEAYGTIDELNSLLGVARSVGLDGDVDRVLLRIQGRLFTIGASLAVPRGVSRKEWAVPEITDLDITGLEEDINEAGAGLEPLKRFILPGGTQAAAVLHLARAVARRAERRCVTLSHREPVEPEVIRYLNRLSDLLFTLARRVNAAAGYEEIHPSFGR